METLVCWGGCAVYGDATYAGDTEAHLVLDFQKEGAGVLHTPILIGHNEPRARLDRVTALFNRQGQCEVMVGAMDMKYALHL